MAEQIAQDEWMCVDKYDISGEITNFGFERVVALEPVVTFPDPTVSTPTQLYERNLCGAESAKAAIAGYLDQAINLPAFEGAITGAPVVTKGYGRAQGSSVVMMIGAQGMLHYGGPVGKVTPVTAQINNNGVVTPGIVYEFGSKTTTGNGTSQTISAVTAGKSRYIHVHVITITGTGTPTITFIYETSALGTYADAVTRYTSPAFTAPGKDRNVSTSVVSDINGRFRWTISGTGSPTFLVRLCEGVR